MYRAVGDMIVEIKNNKVSDNAYLIAEEIKGYIFIEIILKSIRTAAFLWLLSLMKPLFNFDLSFIDEPSELALYILTVTSAIIVFDYIYSRFTSRELLSESWGNNVALIIVYITFFNSGGVPNTAFYLSSIIISIQPLLNEFIHSSLVIKEIKYLDTLLSMKQTDEVIEEIETLFPEVKVVSNQ